MEARAKAWETRREKYGPRGHASSYSRGPRVAVVPSDQPPAADFEEGYPTDRWLAALKRHKFSGPRAAGRWLVGGFVEAGKGISCCGATIERFTDDVRGDCFRLTFVTGGWSGAEDLIHAALGHFWVRHLHSMWQRGGLYEFIIPAALVRTPEQDPHAQP